MQPAATVADQAFRLDDLFDTRKMGGKRALIGCACFGLRFTRSAVGFVFGMDRRNGRLQSSSARSNCSGLAFSDLRPKAACLKAATSFSSRSIRSSLRTSRSCDVISIAFRAAISSGRSTASNILEVYQIGRRLAARICHPSHRDAPIRWLLALVPQRSGLAANRGLQKAPQTAHAPKSSGRPGCLAK